MANKKVWLRAADVMIDEQTGAILVQIGGSVAIDPQAMIDGLGAGKTLADLNATLANLSRIPALGQALAAASVPVVLTAAQLAGLTSNMPSGVSTPLAALATTNAWDANGELAIPAGSLFLHLYLTEDMFLVASTSADEPAGGADGAFYPKGQVHLIPCRGQTKLHNKNATAAAGTIYATAFLAEGA
ncbi:MAG: hypothetical protein ABFD92_07830 [Planctomycetaceae bacterium]|nr:hypothetical protein [Planctomycetaceae bacterium]